MNNESTNESLAREVQAFFLISLLVVARAVHVQGNIQGNVKASV
jgi:hypothetical protein